VSEDVRSALLAKQREIASLIADLTVPPDSFGGPVNRNRDERSGVAGARHSQAAAVRHLKSQQADLERALARIDDGTYGLCDMCGDPIPEARLGIRPWVLSCVACTAQH